MIVVDHNSSKVYIIFHNVEHWSFTPKPPFHEWTLENSCDYSVFVKITTIRLKFGKAINQSMVITPKFWRMETEIILNGARLTVTKNCQRLLLKISFHLIKNNNLHTLSILIFCIGYKQINFVDRLTELIILQLRDKKYVWIIYGEKVVVDKNILGMIFILTFLLE